MQRKESHDTTNVDSDPDDGHFTDMAKFLKISNRFIDAVNIALDDVSERVDQLDTLFETIGQTFTHILRLSSTVTQIKGPSQKLISNYVDKLHKKFDLVAESVVMMESPDCLNPSQPQLLSAKKTQMERLSKLFTEILTSHSLQKAGHTNHSARLVIAFVMRVLTPAKPLTLNLDQDLCWQLCFVADKLFYSKRLAIFQNFCQVLTSFIENAPNYDRQAFTQLLMNDQSFTYSRIYILSLIYQSGKACDSELMAYLCDQAQKLAFNDKNNQAKALIHIFAPFFASIDEKNYIDSLHPNVEFCVNRSNLLLGNIGKMVKRFTMKLQTRTALLLTTDLISKETIQGDCPRDVLELFSEVCEKAESKSELADKLITRLFNYYNEISGKVSVPFTDKLKVIELVAVVARKLEQPRDNCVKATVDILGGTKDFNYTLPTELVSMLTLEGKEQLSSISNKLTTASQIEALTKVGVFDCKEAIFSKLESLNFEVAANLSVALQLMNYVVAAGMVERVLISKPLEKFILTAESSLNQPSTLLKLSRVDVSNHFSMIGALMTQNLSLAHRQVLETVMLEYLINQGYAFSGAPLWKCIRVVSKCWSEDHLVSVLNALFVRVHRSQNEKNFSVHQTYNTTKKVKNFLSFVIPRTIKLQRSTIIALLKLVGHPAVSTNPRVLSDTTKYLIQQCKLPWTEMLEENFEFLIQVFLKERTGILSPDSSVRQIAVNILSQMGQAGLLLKILPEMMPIFNYKPVEMLQKMEKLLKSEFDKMSHYDLMFYAEMTRDMQSMYQEKDSQSIKQSLCQDDEVKQKDDSTDEGKPEIGASLDMDPALMALLAKSKSKKGKKGKLPGKAAPAKTQEAKKQEDAPEISKEERNRLDREQMIAFIRHLQEVKSRQFSACYQVLSNSNQSEFAARFNYQEATLSYLTGPLLKLLSLVSTRFDAFFFLQNLLNSHQESPFFSIKQHLMSGLAGVADNRTSSRTINDISTCLQNLNQNADFTQMGVGSLKICLTISNFVLKDPSVNLSVKEIGLAVSQSILTDCTVVQMIDLVRLTINMMKTNYISPNLNGFLRKLLRRINRFELALLLQPLFQYQPVPRKVLMTEILAFDEPLFNPIWFSAQMWILLFDEELAGLARKIWNKFGMALRTEAVELQHESREKNIFYYLRDEQFGVYSLTSRALGSAMEIFRQSPRLMKVTEDLIKFYHSEWDAITQYANKQVELNPFDTDFNLQKRLYADKRINRVTVPQILKRTAKLFQPQHFETILTFLITEACQDQNEDVRLSSNEAALALVKMQGPEHANQLLAVLETFLNATSGKASLDSSKNQAVVLLGHLAQYLGDTAQKKLVASYENLSKILLNSSESVQKSICKCIPQLAKFFPEKAKNYLETQMTSLRTSKDEKQVRACSYAVAGLAKSLGMKYTKEQQFIQLITDECFMSKKTEAIRKQAGLFFFDAMSFIMGHSFEVYLGSIFPNILSSIADQREPVRNAALTALGTIMGQFSNFAIKQALPQFLGELQNDNWRSKYSTVEALGNMAFCAPKQISSFLPQIVKVLRQVLNDTHEKVHDAAIEAIKKIGSVIKCPEIGDLLEVIVKALSNTNSHLNEALNLIINTSFAHAIDAPSLSLLVPLLDAGLTMHDNRSKEMSATLMGNICSLTQDPQDLLPYMSILVPAIKNSLFDAIPEIRAAAAKGLGKLSKGLGPAQAVEMLGWLREHMDQQTISSSEKSGAAQGFAEMISSHGKSYFEVYIQEVIKKSQANESYLREAYRGVLVFLPGCYEHYVDYLSMLVPIMIQGLADDQDEVRKISMRNVKICIKQFAKSNPFQLINPVLRMMFSTDFRVRESSSILMYQLIKELENDIIKATPTYMDQETKFKILSTLFILRYDPIEKVNNQASQIWKSLIDNQLLVLRQVIDTCIKIIFQIIQSPSEELQEMGLECIRGIVEKMGEKLVSRAIEIFEQLLEKSTDKTQSVGICKVMYNMAGSASYRLLQIIAPRLLSIMEPYLSAEQPELRSWSSKVFITIFQQSEKVFIDQHLENSILKKLKQFTQEKNEVEAERLLETLKMMVDKAPSLKIEDRMLMLCDITEKSKTQIFSIAQARIIRVLASTFATKVFTRKFYYGVLVALQDELSATTIDSEERIQYVLIAYAELLAQIGDNELALINEEITRFLKDCQELDRPGFYLDLIIHYCNTTENNFEKSAEGYLENCLKYLNHPNDAMVTKVITALQAVMEKLPKETQMLHVSLIRRQIEVSGIQVINTQHSIQEAEGNMVEHLYKKKFPFLQIFKMAAGVQAVVNYVQAAIMHGSVQIRVDAAFTLKYVLDFAEPSAIKKEIIKICGALIRVVNDKFPSDLKMQIFMALKLIQRKYADSTKAMAAQLQTTFLKAFGDSAMNEHVQRLILENLLLLVKGLTRVDPIVKELLALLEGNKIEGSQKQLVSEALALIIRAKGKVITSSMQETCAGQLTEILQNPHAMTDNNDIVAANCAMAMAFLSAHADPGQMQVLCNAFQGANPISVGVKFGVLVNGNETTDKKQIASGLKSLLIDYLKSGSGFGDPLNIDSRFSGAFDLLCHLLNTYARRDWCQQAMSPYISLVYEALNESGVLQGLLKEGKASQDQFKLLLSGLAILPVKAEMSVACAAFLKDSFQCIQAFYLEYPQLYSVCSDAILNMALLTYDNWLDTDNMKSTDRSLVKESMQHKSLQGVISDDMRLYAIDIVFKKK